MQDMSKELANYNKIEIYMTNQILQNNIFQCFQISG